MDVERMSMASRASLFNSSGCFCNRDHNVDVKVDAEDKTMSQTVNPHHDDE